MYTDGRIDVSPSGDRYSVRFKSEPSFFVDDVARHAYKWKELEGNSTIRLLRLEKGEQADRLKGSFELCNLSSHHSRRPKYTAISYVWGSPLKLFSLYMADSSKRRSIQLQTSLFLALRRLRQKDRSVLLWADAICIDQTNDSEKARQIPLMSKIYQSAEKVFAWLGEEENDSDQAIELLTKMGRTVLDFRGRTRGWDDPHAFTSEDPHYLPQVGDRKWVAVENLLKRRWFSRIWIVQEAALAVNLEMGCGSKRMPWELLYHATTLCFMKGLWNQNNDCPIADRRTQKNILELGKLRSQATKDGHFTASDYLFDLLQLFHQREVTVPRDRLFALLGMAKDRLEDKLQPRYDNSDEDVITNYGCVFVEQGRGLELLCQARMAGARKKLPSWMPDLTASTYPKTITAWGARVADLESDESDAEFKAAGDDSSTRNGRVTIENKILRLKGYEVDEVTGLGQYASNIDDFILFIEEIFKFVDDVYHSMPPEQRAKVRCRLPIGDTHEPATPSWDPEDRFGEPGDGKATRTHAYVNMLRYLAYRRGAGSKAEAVAIQEAGQAAYIVSDTNLLRRRMWPYYRTVIELLESFRPASAVVCRTKMGRVGIVPRTVEEPGDKIVIFQGSKVPYIIRKSSTALGIYRAVGECYIDGIMHGELFGDGKQRSSLQLQEFRLE